MKYIYIYIFSKNSFLFNSYILLKILFFTLKESKPHMTFKKYVNEEVNKFSIRFDVK